LFRSSEVFRGENKSKSSGSVVKCGSFIVDARSPGLDGGLGGTGQDIGRFGQEEVEYRLDGREGSPSANVQCFDLDWLILQLMTDFTRK